MVTIARCHNLDEAQMLKTRLAGSGITAFIPDEFMAQNEWPALSAAGGIRVQVSSGQAEAARRVIGDQGGTS